MRDAKGQAVQTPPFADRRTVLLGFLATFPASTAHADDFNETPSGLRILELRKGEGPIARRGATVIIHWAGYTKGYQGKRIDNTSARDEPYIFTLSSGQVGG